MASAVFVIRHTVKNFYMYAALLLPSWLSHFGNTLCSDNALAPPYSVIARSMLVCKPICVIDSFFSTSYTRQVLIDLLLVTGNFILYPPGQEAGCAFMSSIHQRLICISVLALFLTALPIVALGKGEFPETDASGFLSSGEFVYEDPEEGIWRYLSPTLRIEIIRHRDEENRLVYTVADIRTQDGERFRLTPKDPENRMKKQDYVQNIALDNNIIFATSSDYAHHRINNKIRPGILVRDGEIISDKTRTENSTKFPNLDTLALFDDGNMKVFAAREHTAEEYLQMGATDVLAFGPILIRGGIVNEAVLRKYGQYREPRVAIGMVEKGHYISIMVEGRHDDSRGINTIDLSQLFLDQGCKLAFNLDGGQSATMVFMGKQIIRVGGHKSATKPARSTAEIFGIGTSPLVQKVEEEAEPKK